MSDHYDSQRAQGDAYEAYMTARLRAEGLTVSRWATKADQLAHGDLCVNGDNVEIKYDTIFIRSGNLFVEVAEKRDRDRATWTPSGIDASSDARYYGIGDYVRFFLFDRAALRNFREAAQPPVITINRETSRGFLLSAENRILLGPTLWRWRSGKAGVQLEDVRATT